MQDVLGLKWFMAVVLQIHMPISQLLFSFSGRINRQSYWLSTLALTAVILVPAFFYFGVGTETADTYVDVASLVLLWPLLAVQAKRWHDRDKSAWWILINFIPVIGLFWAIIENGFSKVLLARTDLASILVKRISWCRMGRV